MDAALAPPPASGVPSPIPPPVFSAWPRPAQLALACLLAVAAALLAVHGYGHSRWGTRPTDLEQGVVLAYRVDLNRADRAELLQLPKVGDSLAERIEQYRREHGAFRSVDELREVQGVGPGKLEQLRPWVCVQTEETEDPDAEPPTSAAPRPHSPGKKSSNPGMPSKKAASLTALIDVNRASREDLQRLPGIGPALSQRIIDARRKGPFQTVEDLRRVSGIGPKKLEALRPYVTVGSEPVRVVTAE